MTNQTYVVRRPGNTAWSTHRSLAAAVRELEKADRVVSGHRLYVESAGGETFRIGDHIEAGTGEDYDTGRIERLDGRMAYVAWDTGAKTPCPIDDLRHIEPEY